MIWCWCSLILWQHLSHHFCWKCKYTVFAPGLEVDAQVRRGTQKAERVTMQSKRHLLYLHYLNRWWIYMENSLDIISWVKVSRLVCCVPWEQKCGAVGIILCNSPPVAFSKKRAGILISLKKIALKWMWFGSKNSKCILLSPNVCTLDFIFIAFQVMYKKYLIKYAWWD